MLLALDVGNTNITIGIFRHDGEVRQGVKLSLHVAPDGASVGQAVDATLKG